MRGKTKVVTVEIEDTKFPAKGVAHCEENTFIIKGAIIGEKLKVSGGRKRNGIIEGKILERLAPSPLSTEEGCPHRPECGGCLYDSLPYDVELREKERELKALFLEYEKIIQVSRPFFYRNKMEFTFGNLEKDGELTLGLHARGMFHKILPVENCKICDKDFITIRNATEKFFRLKKIPFYHRKNNTGTLRHLMIRKAKNTGEILLLLSHTDFELPLYEWISTLETLPLLGKIVSVYHIINNDVGDTIKGEPLLLFGKNTITEKLSGLSFNISPFSFFQTNTEGAEKLYTLALDAISDICKKTVFDLYSGTGTIASIVSRKAKKVFAVELVEEAVNEAKKSAEKNGIDNVEFLQGDVFKVIDSIKEKADLIIVDPPREGLVEKSLRKISNFKAPEILYISCNPTTLVRDIALLKEEGYTVKKIFGLDMFPRTSNVETVALLSKLDVDKHIDVEIKLDELDLTSAESKASYAQIKEYILEKFDLKVSTLYIAQIKKKCGIVLREHYNKSKKEKQVIPQCTPEKEEAIMDALRHFKMI